MRNTAGLVALVVLAIASLLMFFVVLPNVGDKAAPPVAEGQAPPAETALVTPDAATPGTSTPGTATSAPTTPSTTAPAPAGGSVPTAAPTPVPGTPAAPKPAADAKGDRPVAQDQALAEPPVDAAPENPDTPRFDVLRVEPDGSTVIAGRAEPNSKLEIVNGNAVVGTAEVGVTGDFAAIFDKPLPPGDYQLTLRSTGPTGATTSSDEVATVSIPKVANGQLLAMVTKPGEASRILTAPVELAPPAATGTAADTRTAALETPAAPSSTAADPSTSTPGVTRPPAPVAVSAVEIEGGKLFVAGTARPGSTVRVYADDQLVGESKADAQGRFVVDGQIALSVGQHVIRVDMVGADGRVQMRAAVPFERPEGDQISAVAQTPASGTDPAFDGAIFDASRMEAAKAFALLKGLFADGRLPGLDQLAAARSSTEIALGSLAGVKPVAGMQAAVADRVTATTTAAAEALAILKPLPRDAAAVGAALGRLEAAMARVLEVGPATVPATAVPGAPVATLPSATTPSTQTAAGEPETVQQAPLQQSRTSVIIRRGDTLWQISRRVYGAGVRYTTIYVANEDQILDPDRILPGQVFGVPNTAMPDAESQELHRRHMQHAP